MMVNQLYNVHKHCHHICTQCTLPSYLEPTMLTINQLPYDCFYLILERIELSERLQHGSLVCRHWKSTIDTINHTKGSLTLNLCAVYRPITTEQLVINRSQIGPHFSDRNSLVVNVASFGESLCRHIVARFGRVNRLVIRCLDMTELEREPTKRMLLCLLGQHWPHLIRLTLWKMEPSSSITDPTFVPAIALTINNTYLATQLTGLDLYFEDYLDTSKMIIYLQPSLNLCTVLPRLSRFSIHCTPTNLISALLRQLSVNHLSELYLNFNHVQLYHMESIALANPHQFANITHLSACQLYDMKLVDFICGHFRSLQSLQLEHGYTSETLNQHTMNQLSKLEHLTDLSFYRFFLNLSSRCILPNVRSLTVCNHLLFYHAQMFSLTTPSTPLWTVDLSQLTKQTAQLLCRTVAQQFPNLEKLTLVGAKYLKGTKDYLVALEEATRLEAFAQLKRLRTLRIMLRPQEYTRCLEILEKWGQE